MFKEVITLIKLDSISNGSGGFTPMITGERDIFANKKSSKGTEFYQAMQNDLEVTEVFTVYIFDYEEERVIKYNEKYYTVIRRYEKNDFLELSCQRRLGVFEEAIP